MAALRQSARLLRLHVVPSRQEADLHEHSLDWHLLADPLHRSVQDLVRDLNWLYRSTPALHRLDTSPDGFSWVDANDGDNSVLSFLRFAPVLQISAIQRRGLGPLWKAIDQAWASATKKMPTPVLS